MYMYTLIYLYTYINIISNKLFDNSIILKIKYTGINTKHIQLAEFISKIDLQTHTHTHIYIRTLLANRKS